MKNFTRAFTNTKSKLNIKGLLALFALLLMVQVSWAQTSTQSFGTSTGSNSTTTGSTSLLPAPTGTGSTYARGGGGGTAPVYLANTSNPLSTIGSFVRGVASNSTSVTKISPIVGYTGGTEFYTSFKVLFGNTTGGATSTSSGSWTFSQGAGSFFSDNNAYAQAQTFTALRFTYGASGAIALTYDNGAFVTTNLTSSSLSQGVVYTIEIVGNNKTAGTISYTYGASSQTVAVQTFDLYVNGTLIGNDLVWANLPANTSITSIAFTGISSTSNVANIFLDDVVVYNAVPSTIGSSSSTPPTLTAALSPTVDGAFDVTFTDANSFQSKITGAKVGGVAFTALTGAGMTVGTNKITFTPSASSPAANLQIAGTSKAFTVQATGFTDASVSQTIGVGAATKLAITTQPTAPASNGAVLAVQPVVVIQDQYGNTTTSAASITAAVSAGTWTLGGTTSKPGVSGTATFTNLTATSTAAVTGATIAFASTGLTGVTSGTFNIVAPATAPGAPTIGTATATSNTTASVTFTAPVSNGGSAITGYTVTTSPAGGTGTGTTSPISVTGLTFGTAYTFTITATNIVGTSSASATSNSVTPTYCTPSGSTAGTTYFSNFTTSGGVTNINNNSTYSTAGYGDFTAQSVSQYANTNISFNATIVSVANQVGVGVWVDWNKDGDFLDSLENVYNTNGTYIAANPSNISFTVPNGQTIGNYRMRIIVDYNSSTPTSCVAASTARGEAEDYTLTVIASSPTITGTATATAFTTMYGTASTAQTFTVSGSNLTANLVATAPTGFEVANGAGAYGATATFTQTSGTASGTLNVRLAATAAVTGSYNAQTISLTSTSATTKYITTATTGNVVTAKALTITGIAASDKTYDAAVTAIITGTAAYSGFVNSESFTTVTGTPTATFATKTIGVGKTVSVVGYTAPSTNYSITQPSLSATISVATLTVTGASGTNKVYTGTTAAAITGGTLSGVLSTDVVSLTNNAGTFAQTAIGTGITVTPNFSISGTDAGNYTLTQPIGLVADITAKGLTISGLSVVPKVYDGNTTATLTGTPSLVGVIAGDTSNVVLGGTVIANFNQSAIGANIPVTVSGYSLSGSAATNYTLTQPAGLLGDITSTAIPAITSALTASATYGVAASTYTITAENTPISFSADFGFLTGLSVNLNTGAITGTPTAAPGSYNVTISATNEGGPSLPATLVYTIAAKSLTITNAAATTKVYDRTNAAVITGTLNGIVGSDVVTLNGTGTFSQTGIGTGLAVTSTATLGGANAGNYTLTQPTGLTADITAKALTVTGATASNKTYNGLTIATITGATLVGIISPDVVTVNGGGTFASADVANGISVTPSLSLAGADNANYTLTQPTGLSANITTASLTITGLTGANKVYDATRTASTTGTATYVGLQNGETFTVTGSPSFLFASATIGTGKAITASGYTAPSTNYTLTAQPTGLTGNITVASLTIAASAQSKNFGVASTTTGATAFTTSGLQGSDAISTVSLTYTGTPAGNLATATAGTYTITPSAATFTTGASSNYTITYATGTLTINAAVPGAPAITSATAGNGQVSIVYTAPASNGGSAITTYTATSNPGGFTGTLSQATGGTIVVSGLTNGTPYTFTVTATNAAGTGAASAASSSVTPRTVSDAPTIGTAAVAGVSGTATVAFTAPTSNGGSAITGYTVTTSPAGGTGTGTTSPITITGLTNGTAYTFTVKANNIAGASTASAASNSVTPYTVAGAPTIGTATAGNTTASITFVAPASTGGSAITGYTVTSTPGGLTGTGTTSPITVTGLTNGTAYTFTVTATNVAGTSAASAASNSVTPILSALNATNATSISTTGFTANWDAVTNSTGYQLDASTSSTFVSPSFTNVVSWNFPLATDNATADGGITANAAKTISVAGGPTSVSYASTGASTRCISATGWNAGTNSKYWQVDFSTTGYYNTRVSSAQRSSGTGPQDFKLQYKIGSGGTWADVSNGTIAITSTDFTTGVLSNLVLPSACDNQSSVFLRWLVTSTTSESGGTVAAGGTSSIDDILIEGNAGAFVSGYQNLTVSSGTTQTVTGLSAGTTYYYRVRATDATTTTANSNVITVTTKGIPTVTPTIGSYTYNGTSQGPSVATNTGSGSSYTFSYNGVSPTTYGPSATPPIAAGTYTVTATVAADGNYVAATSAVTAFTINKKTLTITANSQSVCFGTPATSVLGAGSYTVFGFVTGEDATVITGTPTYTTTYTATTVAGTASVAPVLSGLSATNYQFTAINGTVTILSNSPASVSVIASATTVCAGTSVTFTATPTNGGDTPSYQWYVDTTPVGTDSATFTSASLTNGAVVTAVVTSNATPCLTGSPATSNAVTMTVNPIATASVSIAASATTTCPGASITFTATPTNGGTTPAYQWYVGATPVGTNSATFTSTTLANNAVVKVVMTSNATTCLSGSPATSNSVTISLYGGSTTITGPTALCSLTSATYSVPPTSASTFTWSVPTWMTIASGQGTRQINVTFPATGTSAQPLSVTLATSNCGTQVVSKSVGCGLYTQLASAYCGSTLSNINAGFLADNISGATMYDFLIGYNGTTDVVSSQDRLISLSEATGIPLLYGTTYTVSVRVKIGGQYGGYGTSCTITTPSVPTTSLDTTYCGSTLSNINAGFLATNVAGANQYEFSIVYDSATYVVSSSDRLISLSEATTMPILYGATYAISVRVRIGSQWSVYGASCNLTTPSVMPTTSLDSTYCGSTLSNINAGFLANNVAGASEYQFSIVYNGITYVVSSTDRLISLPEATTMPLLYGATYAITVRVRIGTQWGVYSSSCNLTTPSAIPTTSLESTYCGHTLSSINAGFLATNIASANQYEFTVSNGTNSYTVFSNDRLISLSEASGMSLLYGATYSITVRVRIGSQWSNSGATCTVSTPSVPTTSLDSTYCGSTLSNINAGFLATNIAGANQYEFTVSNGTNSYIVPSSDRLISLSEASGMALLYGTTYTVTVRVKIGDQWSDSGATCTVTTPNVTLTGLDATYCGSTLSNLYSGFLATNVAGASQYEFTIAYGGSNYTVLSSDRLISLSETVGMPLLYSTAYTVTVKVKIGEQWSTSGSSCTISTPSVPTTALASTYCGQTLSAINAGFLANNVSGANQYDFSIVYDGVTYVVSSPDRLISLSEATGMPLLYGATYAISVRVQIGTQMGNYGTSCNLTTPSTMPTTNLDSNYCGSTLTSLNAGFLANNVSGASEYQFSIVYNNVTYVVSSTDRLISLSEATGMPLVYGATYAITVRVRIGTQWGNYGTSCSLTTPATSATPTTQLQSSQCDYTAVSTTEIIYANSIATATGYRFNLTNTALSYGYIFDSTTNSFGLDTVGGLSPSTTYSVKVSVKIGGVWGAYGKPCTLTTPGTEKAIVSKDIVTTVFDATAYPNPFAENFKLDIKTSNEATIQVKVYDMLGKLIENQILEPTQVEGLEVGANYPSGVYNVIVSQGEDVKTLRVIKR